MDPSPLISQSVIPEMWQFPMIGVVSAVRAPAAGMSLRDVSAGESTVTEQSGGNRSRKKRRDTRLLAAVTDAVSEEDSSKFVSTSSGGVDLVFSSAESESKPLKVGKSIDEFFESKVDAEANSDGNKLDQPSEPPKQDFIHVRARRGQATDSHSLAERARREKISERMKILQDLVPGCDKVIGKASVLDEIINYIQALQRQVEFLSMKLEAVNSRINTGLEGFPIKDLQYDGGETYENISSLAFASQTRREYAQGSATEWLHMQVGGTFERVT